MITNNKIKTTHVNKSTFLSSVAAHYDTITKFLDPSRMYKRHQRKELKKGPCPQKNRTQVSDLSWGVSHHKVKMQTDITRPIISVKN